MYIYEAYYAKVRTDEEITRSIEFNGENFFNTEKEISMFAMGKAYDLMEEGEAFVSLELIGC